MSDPIVITGATSGIGQALAHRLSQRGHHLVLLARRADAGQALARALGADLVVADLSTREGRDRAGLELAAFSPGCVVHNAGVWPARRVVDDEGVEQSFAVHALAPHALQRALPSLRRVVYVNAGLYALGRLGWEEALEGRRFHPLKTYADSKLAQAVLARELSLRRDDLVVHTVHPGVVQSRLGDRNGPLGWMLRQAKRRWKPTEAAAESLEPFVLTSTDERPSGHYWNEDDIVAWHPMTDDRDTRAHHWDQADAWVSAPPDR